MKSVFLVFFFFALSLVQSADVPASIPLSETDGRPWTVPNGAKFYEHVNQKVVSGINISTKETGYKMTKDNGDETVVGPWKSIFVSENKELDGIIVEQGFYDNNGVKQGVWKNWYIDSYIENNYVDGKKCGLGCVRSRSGLITHYAWFKDDKLDGISVSLDDHQKVLAVEKYVNGERKEGLELVPEKHDNPPAGRISDADKEMLDKMQDEMLRKKKK